MKDLETLLQHMQDKRIDILNEFVDFLTEQYKMIKESERLEDYEFCEILESQINIIIESYCVELDKTTSNDSLLKHECNIDVLKRLSESIKTKILK